MGQVVSRVKPLEPNTSQVGTLLWMLNHKNKKNKNKKNIILGIVVVFQIHSQAIDEGFKGFNPLANK